MHELIFFALLLITNTQGQESCTEYLDFQCKDDKNSCGSRCDRFAQCKDKSDEENCVSEIASWPPGKPWLFEFKDIADKSPFPNEDPHSLNKVLMSKERQTLKDCHLKNFKYGSDYLGQGPVYGGEPARIQDFQHIGAIGWTEVDDTISWNCGGSLITELFVLSASHCTRNNLDIEPDVARFGDLNIYDNSDDKNVQQVKIVQSIRHPEHRFKYHYNDIALMKLEKEIMITDYVIPACIWTLDAFRFNELEAAGWGSIGPGEEKSEILLKVSLKPLKNEECKPFYSSRMRRLPDGIVDSQLCALGTNNEDTCPGDSGGPLQIQLVGYGKRIPFLVGLTSFGKACGISTPGVYTRISSFVSWIETVVNRTMKAEECFNTYSNYKDLFESSRSSEYGSWGHNVEIVYDDGTNKINCRGSIIEQNFILTSAQCVSKKGPKPTHINIKDQKIKIAEIFQHPNYEDGSLYDDLAVVKLEDDVQYDGYIQPACLWPYKNMPFDEVYLQGFHRYLHSSRSWSVGLLDSQSCPIYKDDQMIFNKGVTQNQICTGNPWFHFPEFCRFSVGASPMVHIQRFGKILSHLFGIQIYGPDCGFGNPAVSTKVSSYYDWIESIVLPNRNSDFHFQEVDENICRHTDNSQGVCVTSEQCPELLGDQKRQKLNVCSFGGDTKVCCPKNMTSTPEIDDSENIYGEYYRKIVDYNKKDTLEKIKDSYNPSIGILKDKDGIQCLGVLITKQTVLTTTNCIKQSKSKIDTITFGLSPNEIVYNVSEIVAHPEYDAKTFKNDLAVVKLTEDVQISDKIIPSCIWSNSTHNPFDLTEIKLVGNGNTKMMSMIPLYNTDCQKSEAIKIESSHICVQHPCYEDCSSENKCSNDASQLFYHKINFEAKKQIIYAVGSFAYRKKCSLELPVVYTRFSSYIDWIKSVI